MTIVQKLIDLGFAGTTDLGTKDGKTLVRVWTDKGWAYERLQSEDEAVAWAKDKVPGE